MTKFTLSKNNPAFGLNTARYFQSKYGKIRTRMTPNTSTFYAVRRATNRVASKI